MPRTAPEKQTVTIKETWTDAEVRGFGALNVDWPNVSTVASGGIAGHPVARTAEFGVLAAPDPWHLLCWLLGHAPYANSLGLMYCARCLRNLP